MKRGLLGILPILFINLVSAQFFSGYGRFSLTGLLDSFDPQTITLFVLFVVFFAFINMATSKIFKDPYGYPNRATAGIVSFAITSLIIYGIYRTGFNFENIFYNIGFSTGSLYPILSILFLVVAVLLIWKFKLRGFFLIFGALLLGLTMFTDIFYEKGITFAIGVGLLLIGLWLWGRARRMGGGRLKEFGRKQWRKEKDVMKHRWRYRTDPRYKADTYRKKILKKQDRKGAKGEFKRLKEAYKSGEEILKQ